MTQNFKIMVFTSLFIVITLLLIIAEYFNIKDFVFILKPLLIPSLCLIYITTSIKKSTWYLVALFFAFLSNVFLLYSDSQLLLYGILAFLIYRLVSIYVIIRNGDSIYIVPLVLATIPFLFIFSYLIHIMISPDNPSFYATIINDFIISIFCGIGLSNYVMNDNKQNSWLLISTLLFTFLVILFMFDKFYLSFQIFKPISALVFSLAHYAFLMFMVEEKN